MRRSKHWRAATAVGSLGVLVLAACSSPTETANKNEGGSAGVGATGGAAAGANAGGSVAAGGGASGANAGGSVAAGGGASGAGSTSGGSDGGGRGGASAQGGTTHGGSYGGTGPAGSSGANTGGSTQGGGQAVAGAPPGPASCSGLTLSADSQALYALPSGSTWSYAGADERGAAALLAVAVTRSVRLVSVDAKKAMTELLNEAEYKKNWSLDPIEVRATRTGADVDVLVTDNAQMTLLRKRAASVEVSSLAHSSSQDLHVLGVAPSSGLALYFKGDDTRALESTLSIVSMDQLVTTTRTFSGPANLSAVSDAAGTWLAAERLALDEDCTDSGRTQNCSGGATAVPIYTCTWHVDVWSASSTDALRGPPLATIDVPASISPKCGDATPAGLATLPALLGRGAGFAGHHALAIDPNDNALAVAVQRDLGSGNPAVQFEKVGADGKRTLMGVTAPVSAVNANSWLAVRAGRVFLCGDYNCGVGDASGGKSFKLDQAVNLLDTRGILLLPNGVGLIGGLNPSLQEVSCKP